MAPRELCLEDNMMETAEQFIKRKTEKFEQKNRGKLISMKDIGRKGKWFFSREAFTFMKQHNYENKVFIIERLRKEKAEGRIDIPINWKKGDIEYRICYYIVGQNGPAINKWRWGQSCPIVPHEDFQQLIQKAIKEGTLKDKIIGGDSESTASDT